MTHHKTTIFDTFSDIFEQEFAFDSNARRDHKNTLFCDLFSIPENALELYNAIHHTHYTNVDDLAIVTISNIIYLHHKNDVGILFDSRMTLWEHQSTLNPNMPLRGLIYYAITISRIISMQKLKIYSKNLEKIPTPSYFVLYNGKEDAPDRQDLHLSDAFLTPAEGYEWTAHFININAGHNPEILNNSKTLKGYSTLVSYVRKYQEAGIDDSTAIDMAIKRCIDEDILADYLLAKRSEAKFMFMTEFDEELLIESIRSDVAIEEEKLRQQIASKDKLISESRQQIASKDQTIAALTRQLEALGVQPDI